VNPLYVVAVWVPRRETIAVGALGPVTLERSWYAYVGSARRGRDARVARHMRAAKPLRWHADYLFSRHPATRAWIVDTELSECELAARLRAALERVERRNDGEGTAAGARPARHTAVASRATAGFGAGDCGCPGHLVVVGRSADLDRLLRALPRRAGRVTRALPG
jgi:Uri superfamily endonuclease